MLAGMAPTRQPGTFAFATLPTAAGLPEDAIGAFREAEGWSVIRPCAPDAPLAMVQITLGVVSALDGVGLTASVAGALAEADIPCNVVAAHHHDHIFVPAAAADMALAILRRLSAAAAAPATERERHGSAG